MKFKRKTIGTWLQINSNEILNLLKNSSFDWVVFDLEHGNIAIDDLATLVQIAKYNNLIPFCRLSKPCENEAMLVLEKGIEGIIFPRIKDEKECLRLSNACLYPPKGNRGVGFSISNNFGLNLKKNIKTFKPLIIMMIENTTSYLNLKKIIN